MDLKTTRFRFVEVVLNNTAQQQFYFDTDATLQKAVKIVGIEVFSVTDVPKSPITGKSVVADTVLAKSFLTVVNEQDDNEVISMMPLAVLNRKSNNGEVQQFNIETPNITKCYIRISDTTGLTGGTIWLLGIHYIDRKDFKRLHQNTIAIKH